MIKSQFIIVAECSKEVKTHAIFKHYAMIECHGKKKGTGNSASQSCGSDCTNLAQCFLNL